MTAATRQRDAVRSRQAEATFRRNLRAFRVALGWSQQHLADEMTKRGQAWYQSTVAAIELGARRVELGEAIDVAGCFDIEPSRMWTDDGTAVGEEEVALRRRAAELVVQIAAADRHVEAVKASHDALVRSLA